MICYPRRCLKILDALRNAEHRGLAVCKKTTEENNRGDRLIPVKEETMLMWIRQLLAPPTFDDADRARTAALLNTMLLILLGTVVVIAPFVLFNNPDAIESNALILGLAFTSTLGLLLLLRWKYVQLAGMLFSCVLVALGLVSNLYFEGIRGAGTGVYFVVIIVAGLLLGGRMAIAFGLLSMAITLGVTLAEINGTITFKYEKVVISTWFIMSTALGVAAVLLHFAVNSIVQALERARQNEQEAAIFRAMAENASSAILMASMDGHITYVNPASYTLLGYNRKQHEIVGRPIADVITTKAGDQSMPDLSLAVTDTGNWQGDVAIHRKAGDLFDGYVNGFLIQGDTQQPIAQSYIIQDVSEQKQAEAERADLQNQVIEAQRNALRELSAPVIPVVQDVIVMPLIGSIDTQRARDITRALLEGVTTHQAKVVILDITGVPVVDSGVAGHLHRAIQALQLKGARTIITGVSNAVAETIIDLGIDWREVDTLRDLQTGLMIAIRDLKIGLNARR
jgi:PAS domain S-box-containing protein